MHLQIATEVSIFGASLSEPHIDHDNIPRRGECLYVRMYVAAGSVCRLNVPENTPIQSITRSARAHQTAKPIAAQNMESL